MTLKFILSLIAALGIGSIVATLIQINFENWRFKIERTSNLNKEIYFKKVAAWERVCIQMALIENEMIQYVTALSGGQVLLAHLNISIGDRIKELSVLDVWFSKDVRDAWNKINEPYDVIYKTYLAARAGTFTTEQGDEAVRAIPVFNEAIALVKEKIRAELDAEKSTII